MGPRAQHRRRWASQRSIHPARIAATPRSTLPAALPDLFLESEIKFPVISGFSSIFRLFLQ
jgi:hypothetical protein